MWDSHPNHLRGTGASPAFWGASPWVFEEHFHEIEICPPFLGIFPWILGSVLLFEEKFLRWDVTSRVLLPKSSMALEIPILEKFHKNPPRPRCSYWIPGFFCTLGILEWENEDGILEFSFPGGSRFSRPAGEGDEESQEFPEDHKDPKIEFGIISIPDFGISMEDFP